MSKRNPQVVSASEIGSWVYCPEAWRLQALGHASGNQEALDRGERRHAEMASTEIQAGAAQYLGWFLIVGAVVLFALALFVFLRGR